MRPFDPGEEKYVSLVTLRKSGVEVATPVWIAQFEDAYYVFSESKAGKVKRIRNNPRVKIAACDIKGKLRDNQWIEGVASLETSDTPARAIYAAFVKKYPIQMRFGNVLSTLAGRINNRLLIKLDLESPATE